MGTLFKGILMLAACSGCYLVWWGVAFLSGETCSVVAVGDFAGGDGGLWDYGGKLDGAGQFFRQRKCVQEFLLGGFWLVV